MTRRQLDALRGNQVQMRVVDRRRRPVNGLEHALVLLGPGDRQHARIGLFDLFGFGAHAAGDDDLAVLGHGRADRRQRFLLGAIQEAAGVDDHDVGAVMFAGQLIALRPKPGDDALGIDQRLWTSERNKADLGRGTLLHLGTA